MAKLSKKTKGEAKRLKDYAILVSPVVTEKSASFGAVGNRAVFCVDHRATKPEIQSAIERIFGVHVTSVRTVNVQGKTKRSARGVGKRSDYKKAYITLKEGETLSVVEGL